MIEVIVKAALIDKIAVDIHQADICLIFSPFADSLIHGTMDKMSIRICGIRVLLIFQFPAEHHDQRTGFRKTRTNKCQILHHSACVISAEEFIFFRKVVKNFPCKREAGIMISSADDPVPVIRVSHRVQVFKESQTFAGTFSAIDAKIGIRQDADKNNLVVLPVDSVIVHSRIGKGNLPEYAVLLLFRKACCLHQMRGVSSGLDQNAPGVRISELRIEEFCLRDIGINLKQIAWPLHKNCMLLEILDLKPVFRLACLCLIDPIRAFFH